MSDERLERMLESLAATTLLVGLAASVWHLFALQAPQSPFHAGVLPGPIAALRDASFGCTAASVLGARTLGRLSRRASFAWVCGVWMAGVVVLLAALGYAAATGRHGVQIVDPRDGAQPLFYARALGHALIAVVGIETARRLLMGEARPRS